MKNLLIFAAAFILGAAASAHAAPQSLTPKCNAPIKVSADRFLADLNAKTGTYSGNVVVTQCDMRMRANALRVNVKGKSNAPDKVLASGGVVMDSPNSGTATGDSAVYDVTPRIVTLSGHVVLTKGKDVMRGAQLTVNLVTGQATLGGGRSAPGKGSERVQGVFTPEGQ